MGIDYTTTLGYGVSLKVPEDLDDPEGWLDELLRPFDLSYMVVGSYWSGDIEHYAVSEAHSAGGRCGGARKISQITHDDDLSAFIRERGDVITDPVPGWWLGLLIS